MKRTRAPHWLLFGGLAAAVVVVDQVTKAWITSLIAPGETIRLIGDELRLVITYNSGGVFGLFRDQAPLFAAFSVAVMAAIVVFQARSGSSRYLSVTLGFLLGGAIGNFIDRIRLGHVIDFVDGGLGATRFYTFNVADMAVTASVLLLLALMFLGDRLEPDPADDAGRGGRGSGPSGDDGAPAGTPAGPVGGPERPAEAEAPLPEAPLPEAPLPAEPGRSR